MVLHNPRYSETFKSCGLVMKILGSYLALESESHLERTAAYIRSSSRFGACSAGESRAGYGETAPL